MTKYTLLFQNESGSAGKLCLYQDLANSSQASNQLANVLAWKVESVNPSVQVQFTWETDYNFVWFDYDSAAQSQQIQDANITSENNIKFTINQYGYLFKTPTAGQAKNFSIAQSANIPSEENVVIGIGMNGSGTVALVAEPNVTSTFTPIADQDLTYWISFGNYIFGENDIITPGSLNSPGKIIFPSGVFSMTAILTNTNAWDISSTTLQLDVEVF